MLQCLTQRALINHCGFVFTWFQLLQKNNKKMQPTKVQLCFNYIQKVAHFASKRHYVSFCTPVYTTGLLLPTDVVIVLTFTVSGNIFLAASMIFFFTGHRQQKGPLADSQKVSGFLNTAGQKLLPVPGVSDHSSRFKAKWFL